MVYEVNYVYVNGEISYVSLNGEAAAVYAQAEKAKGNQVTQKSYLTTDADVEAVSDKYDN